MDNDREDPKTLWTNACKLKNNSQFAAAFVLYKQLTDNCGPGVNTYWQAYCLEKLGRTKEALATYARHAIWDKEWWSMNGMYDRAIKLLNKERYEDAIYALEQMLYVSQETMPGNYQFYLKEYFALKGLCFKELGRRDEAIASFSETIANGETGWVVEMLEEVIASPTSH